MKRAPAIGFVAGCGLLAAACGGGSPGVGVMPPTNGPTLVDVQAQVFTPRCALSGCHTGTTAPFGLDLGPGSSAGNLIGVPAAEVPAYLRVEPFDAGNSYLYMKLVDDPRISGDRMPASGTPLNAADLNLVESWIDQGAM